MFFTRVSFQTLFRWRDTCFTSLVALLYIYECIHIYIYIYTYIYIYIYIYVYIHVYAYIYICIYIYIYSHIHIYIYIHTHTNTYIYIYTHTHTYIYIYEICIKIHICFVDKTLAVHLLLSLSIYVCTHLRVRERSHGAYVNDTRRTCERLMYIWTTHLLFRDVCTCQQNTSTHFDVWTRHLLHVSYNKCLVHTRRTCSQLMYTWRYKQHLLYSCTYPRTRHVRMNNSCTCQRHLSYSCTDPRTSSLMRISTTGGQDS